MTIFHLLVYSCITANGLDGELIAKTCRWDSGDMFTTTARCEEAGAKALMSQIFGDVYEDRRVEKHKCMPVWVNQ